MTIALDRASRPAPRTEPVGACPLCGAPGAAEFFRSPDLQHDTPGEFTYRRCRRCRTVFQDPRVVQDDLWMCYPAEYGTHYAPPAGATAHEAASDMAAPPRRWGLGFLGLARRALARVGRARAHQELLDELRPPGGARLRALDAGCGAGALLGRLARAGYDAEGVEIDPAAAEVARRVSGRPVRVGDFRALDLPVGAYDVVVLSHVFEHLHDPLAALRRLRELAKPGGRVVLLYPNPESLGARVFGRAWFNWDPPRHLVVPRGRALADAAARVGFTVLGLRTAGPNAHIDFKHSRAVRAGRTGYDLRVPPESAWDDVAAGAERLLTRVGARAGEEVILTLQADG